MHGVLALAVLRLALRADLGFEWDSNANRYEQVKDATPVDAATSSFLLRGTLLGTLRWRRGANALQALAGASGKVFFNSDVNDQDALVLQSSIEDRARVSSRFEVGGGLDYYDAWQLDVPPPCSPDCPSRHHDFRSGAARARVAFLDEQGSLALYGGWRGLQYKPDPASNFQAGVGGALAKAAFSAGPAERPVEIDLSAGVQTERRFFDAQELQLDLKNCDPSKPIGPQCLMQGPERRSDWFHTTFVELTVVHRVLVTVGYGLQLNLSNSFGWSLLRHVVTAKLGFRVPWELYFTLKGQLQIEHNLDPILFRIGGNTQSFESIEDENRNIAILDVERPLKKLGLAVNARYSFYTNELGAQSVVSFARHVVYLGVSYQNGLSR